MTAAAARVPRLVLLTGATGYVGGRLLRLLEERGELVRCFARRPEALTPRHETTSVVAGDVLDTESLRPALRGVDSAYYLVHSMGSGERFEELDRRAARSFATAARDAGVRRIVYLGGLGETRAPRARAGGRRRRQAGAAWRRCS